MFGIPVILLHSFALILGIMNRSLVSRTGAKAAATAETGTTTYPLIHTTCSPACQSEAKFLQFTCRTDRPPRGLQGMLLRQVAPFL